MSGLPKPRSMTSSPARRRSSFSLSVTAKTYGGSSGMRRNSTASTLAGGDGVAGGALPGGEVEVPLEERDLGLGVDTGLRLRRADVLLGKPVERLPVLPDVGDADPVIRLRHPVGEGAGRSLSTRLKAHRLQHA